MPGQPAARLSEHYKLDCDFGKPILALYKTGDGSDAVYLCGNHLGEVRTLARSCADVRLIAGEAPGAAPQVAAGVPMEARQGAEATPVASRPPGTSSLEVVSRPKPVRAERAAGERATRGPARDLAYGNAAKVLVDESIWNLATGDYELYKTALQLGKSAGEAAQAAGGQLAVVHRKICEYGVKFESVLAASTAKIDARAAIDDPFERAMLEIMSSTAMEESEKEGVITELGSLQQSLSQAIGRAAEPEVTPLQAHRLAYLIGERANWGTNAALPEELKAAFRLLYVSARSALRSAVPHAQGLEERLTNLHVAKSELEKEPPLRKLQSLSA